MRTIDQLEGAVAATHADHATAMGRLLAAERKYDRARTSWGQERARKAVLACIEEARVAEGAYRGAQLDLALMRWDMATRYARECEAAARHAVDKGKGAETVNAAIEKRDNAVTLIPVAAAEVERWKPVP